ncbi:MAG: hypothetical protein DRQ06_03615, partial [Candidatus Hydrothermota bacterium]
KYDPSGNLVWNRFEDNGNDDCAYAVAVDASDNVYVTGSAVIGNNSDFYTVKYDSQGNLLWSQSFDCTSNDVAQGIAVDSVGNVYVTGIAHVTPSDYDFLTLIYDSAGNLLWCDTLEEGTYSWGIAVDGYKNIYLTGKVGTGYDGDILTVRYLYQSGSYESGAPGSIVRFALSSLNRGGVDYSCYLPGRGLYELQLFDVGGRLLEGRSLNPGGPYHGRFEPLRSGLYFLVLKGGGSRIVRKTIVLSP